MMQQMPNSNLSVPAPIVVEPFLTHAPNAVADACVIWLHGLGADGHDFEGLLPELDLPKNAKIRFIFPTAPLMPVTLNMGMEMRAWYDIASMQLRQKADWDMINLSSGYVVSLVQTQLAQGIPSDRIVLAGFSQGGVIALHSALLCQSAGMRLAGVLALSTYYPEISDQNDAVAKGQSFAELSILMAHGLYDNVCDIAFARASKVALQDLNAQVSWLEYPMAHQVCAAEIADLSAFIQDKLPE
ncbi:carboxylesterase [Thiosulfativibrio zosterae]|uniref:Carboxylesterase n=2 Tax=Thiosulfativibrio zosterae TaxID=2675053 RepID=A0A6F8PKM4_9GAMM|nr:carboxylesterase [Thiosulfativibrio zosterae]